jgi:signal transduction histidine kinase
MTALDGRVPGPGLTPRGHLAALLRLAEHLAVELDEAEVIRVLLDAVTAALEAPYGRGVLVVDDRLTVAASIARDGAGDGAADEPDRPTPAAEAVRTGSLVVVEDIGSDDRFSTAFAPFGSRRARAGLAVPLTYAGRAVGALAVGFGLPRVFSEEELELISGLASAGAVALERARLAREELSSRGMLETVLAQIPVGLAVTDAAGSLLFRNAALEMIWRGPVPIGDGTPTPAWHASHPSGRPYSRGEWPGDRCLAGASVVDEEIVIDRFDGSRGVVSVSAQPIRDARGDITGGVVAVLDVTPRREAEAMRDAFIHVLSHELRTPITSIYGAAKVLASRWPRLTDDLRGELLADVAAESDRLQRLVEDLVVLAKVERGVDLSVSEPVLLQHRVRAVVAALAPEWPDRTMVVELTEGLPPALGDDGYVEQVLRNLIGNAAKYGRSTVRVRVSSEGEWVTVDVLDDGPGLAPDEAGRLFELFYRGRRTSQVAGAGIGLFVAQRLVAAMEGRLTAGNRPEGGAAFVMALKRAPEDGVDHT